MVETDRREAQIYQLRAVLRCISPVIWRRLLVRSDTGALDFSAITPGRNTPYFPGIFEHPAVRG
jgi:hypothetical protein